MVGKEKAELSKEHQEQRMNAIHKQQKEYYDSLEKKSKKAWNEMIDNSWGKNVPYFNSEEYRNKCKEHADNIELKLLGVEKSEIDKAFEKGLNDYYNDLLKEKTPTKSMSDINEGYLWEEDIKRATKRKLDAIKKEDKAQKRKRMPVYSGVMKYFPDALLAVSECSMAGNSQHHEDKPLHWDRNKSNDHLDCLARHLIDADKIDDDGIAHLTKVAWRSLAALQIYLEENK